jgi:predicted Zn-ribbon and HTH transcriptional regulator
MRFSEYTLENTPIKASPQCPKCKALMYLARVAPDAPGFDRRSFECPRCQHVEISVVKFEQRA